MVSVFLQLVLGVAIVAAGTADPATVVEEGLGLSNGGVSSEDLVPTKTTGYDFVVAIPDDIPDEIGEVDEPSGKGVTTRGWSGLLMGSQSSGLLDSAGLVLDQAGRNAPAMRQKERMTDYIATRISDLNRYIADEVLNEDRLFILQDNFKGNSH